MTPSGETVATLFRFDCRLCAKSNEYRHQHRDTVVPHVLFTACTHCGSRNRLDGIAGVRVDPPRPAINRLVLHWEPSDELPLDAVSCEQCGAAMSITRMKPAWMEKVDGEFVRHKAMFEFVCPNGHELLQEAPVFQPSPPIGDPGWTGTST